MGSRGGSFQKPPLWLFPGGFLFPGLSWDPRGPGPAPSTVSPPFCPTKSLQLGVWPWRLGPGGKVVGFRAAVQPQTQPFMSPGLGFFMGRTSMLHRGDHRALARHLAQRRLRTPELLAYG